MLFSDTASLKLKEAFEIYNASYCETMPKELTYITFSHSFERKMQKLLSLQKKSYFYAINTAAKRVAILILALLITLTATTFGVKAIGKAVKDFIIETFTSNTDTVSSDTVNSVEQNTSQNNSITSDTSEIIPSSDTSSEISSENNNSNLISSILSEFPFKELEKKDYYKYAISSSVTDYITLGDTIYLLLEFPNKIMIIDTNSGEVLKNEPLDSRPGEINLINDDFWVSYPSLKQIIVYDKNNFTEKARYSFQHEIHSFDVNNNYIVYSSSEQHCEVYRYSILSKEEKQITFYWYNSCGTKIYEQFFYQPNIIINKELGLLYIGESGTTACMLWCLDIETLELKTFYRENDYGFCNSKRKMYLLEDSVYWGVYEFDAADISKVKSCYRPERYVGGGMLYVNKEFIITVEGLYLLENGTKILDFNIEASLVNAAITDSGNLIYSDNKFTYIIQNISKAKADSLPF